MFAGPVHAHHDDADADADPADDVQLAVEHLVNSRRTALMIQGRGRERKNILDTEVKTAPVEDDNSNTTTTERSGCVRQARYRGDEGLQAILFGADVFGGVNHRPRGAAAVQLRAGSHNISSSREKRNRLMTPGRMWTL